jgi:hypothetical protein
VLAVTHSAALLTDAGIRPEEVAALCPGPGGTEIRVGPEAVRYLLAVEATVPETSPPQRLPEATVQLDLDL